MRRRPRADMPPDRGEREGFHVRMGFRVKFAGKPTWRRGAWARSPGSWCLRTVSGQRSQPTRSGGKGTSRSTPTRQRKDAGDERVAQAQTKPSRRSEPTRSLSEADDVRLYLEAAAREPLLTKEEEVELAMGIEHGEESEEKLKAGRLKSETSIRKAKELVRKGHAARQRFIRANLRLVVSIARKYQGQGLPFLDLIQECNIGLMRAVELVDWRRGSKFSTYATRWIGQAIIRG